MRRLKPPFIFEFLFLIFLFGFSIWLFWSTFGIDTKNGEILIDNKLWSDFASHLPLIRSFSWGTNFPPEYPLFSGEPIKYHFLFYALVGFLERIGLQLDLALNILSAIGFFGLLLAIYYLAKLLFKSKVVGVLAVTFFLFNGSFSFLEFFKIHPLSWQIPWEIANTTTFPSFGPYDGKIIAAFWNLNIYTNQRHLALAFAWILVLVLIFLKYVSNKTRFSVRKSLLLGIILGLLSLFHSGVFLMGLLLFGIFFLLFFNYRLPLFSFLLSASILGLPQILFLKLGTSNQILRLNPGYLIAGNFTPLSFLNYWFLNLGLGFVLIPIGFWLADKTAKKAFLAFSSLFFIANIFQFSPEMAANHKFFNLWLIIGNMFSALVIVWLWQKRWIKAIVPFLLILFTLSGIIDFFAIKNDSHYRIYDAKANPAIDWIKNNTSPDAVFLNSSFLYHPASLAGRRIFLGWPYFAWSLGYDTDKRGLIQKEIFEGNNLYAVCKLLKENKIDYITTEALPPHPEFGINSSLFEQNFPILYQNPTNHNFTIYGIDEICV